MNRPYTECLKKSAIKSLTEEQKHDLKLALAYIGKSKLVSVIGLFANCDSFTVIGTVIRNPISAKKYRRKAYPDKYYNVGLLRRLIAA